MTADRTQRPYVSVSGIRTLADAGAARQLFLQHGFSSSAQRQGSIGICITSDILFGKRPPGPRYIHPENIRGFLELPQDFGRVCLHYAPDPQTNLCDQISLIFEKAGMDREIALAIQINHAGASATDLQKVKACCPNSALILQIADAADLQGKAASVAAVLIDDSRGGGIGMNPETTAGHIRAIREAFPDVSVGVAGGLNAENLIQTLNRLRNALPSPASIDSVSIDAETGLRDRQDALCLRRMERYIETAAQCHQVA